MTKSDSVWIVDSATASTVTLKATDPKQSWRLVSMMHDELRDMIADGRIVKVPA